MFGNKDTGMHTGSPWPHMQPHTAESLAELLRDADDQAEHDAESAYDAALAEATLPVDPESERMNAESARTLWCGWQPPGGRIPWPATLAEQARQDELDLIRWGTDAG